MKTNSKMSALMKKAGIGWPLAASDVARLQQNLEVVEGSVLLAGERKQNQHVQISGFPDRTGFESFLNHVHLVYNGTNDSLVSCLSYAESIGKVLIPFAKGRSFRVIISISEGDCTI